MRNGEERRWSRKKMRKVLFKLILLMPFLSRLWMEKSTTEHVSYLCKKTKNKIKCKKEKKRKEKNKFTFFAGEESVYIEDIMK